MVFFELSALADAAQLKQRVPSVAFVLGEDDVFVVRFLDNPDLDQLSIGDEVQGDEVSS